MNSCGSRPTSIRLRPTNTPMPWSTWTTRSPTLRSRKSDRNVRVAERAALVDLALFLEDVGLGPELEPGVRQPEAAATDGRRRRGRPPRARPRRAPSARRRSRSRRGAQSCARRGPASARRRPSCRRARGRDGSPRPSPARGRRTRPPADRRCGPCRGSSSVSASVSSAVAPSSQRLTVVPVDQQRPRAAATRWPFSSASS